jgi:hypothetical protein
MVSFGEPGGCLHLETNAIIIGFDVIRESRLRLFNCREAVNLIDG